MMDPLTRAMWTIEWMVPSYKKGRVVPQTMFCYAFDYKLAFDRDYKGKDRQIQLPNTEEDLEYTLYELFRPVFYPMPDRDPPFVTANFARGDRDKQFFTVDTWLYLHSWAAIQLPRWPKIHMDTNQ